MSNIINISTILMKRGNTAAASAYVGPLGELLVDTGEKTLRLQDGATPGGMATLVNSQQLANVINTVEGLSSTTANVEAILANIHNANLSSITSNLASIQSLISGNVGNITLGDGNLFLTTYPDGLGNLNAWVSTVNNNTGIYISPSNTNEFAELYLPADLSPEIGYVGAAGIGGFQVYGYNGQYTVNLVNNVNITANSAQWTFDGAGNLTMPTASSQVVFPYNVNSNAVIDYTQDIGQFFILQNNFVDGYQSINLDTDDALVRISSKNSGGYPLRTWSFDWQGQLTFPDNSIQSTAYQGPAGQTSFATVANVTTANLALKGYVDSKFSLLANAPAILDTLGQIATAIQTDEANIGTLLTNLTSTNANVLAANVAWQANAATQQSSINAINANVVAANAKIATLQTQVYTNANVAAYLLTYTGNLTAGNLTVSGNINYVGNVNSITIATGTFQGNAAGFGALYAGILSGYTYQPQTVLQNSTNFNGYAQVNHQNINNGANASTDYVATADTGTAGAGYIDMGINSSGFVNGTGNELNYPLDGYLYAQGTTGTNGNLILGTSGTADIVFTTGGFSTTNNYQGRFKNNVGLILAQTTQSTGTASGALQVAGGAGIVGNVYIGGNLIVNGSNVIASINSINSNVTAANLNITNLQSNIGSFYTYANLNYGTSSYANANVAGYLAGNVTIGNVTATYFIGNGSKLTSVTAQYLGAAQVTGGYTSGTNTGYLSVGPNGLVQSSAYGLTLSTPNTYPGSNNINISPGTGGNVVLQGNIVAAGNIFYGSSFNATANVTAPNFLYPNGVSILTGISGTYSNTQVAAYLLGNITTGNIGIPSSGWIDFRNSDTNWRMGYGINAYSKTTAITSLDVVVGSGTAGPDGFTVGQTGGASIFELVGSTKNAWHANNVTVVGNITSGNVLATGFFYANGTPFTSSSYGNTQVAAYLVANPQTGTYSNTNVAAYIGATTFSAISSSVLNSVGQINGTAVYIQTNGSHNFYFDSTGNLVLPSGGAINYSNGQSILTGISSGAGTYSNTNVAAYLTTQTFYSNSNVAAYLVANPQSGTYSNTNVSAYLTSATINTTGNITAGNLTTSGTYTVANITTTGAYGNITGANVISANSLQVSTGIFWSNGTAWSSSGGGTTYSNANVVANLANFVTNISTTANITTTANIISPNYLFANGVNILSTVTGGSGTYSNTNVSAYLTANPISSIVNGGSSVAIASSGGNAVVQIGGVSTATFSQSQLNVIGNVVASANIQGANIIATQYGNSIGTTASYSGNVSANYFVGNGVALTGLTYNNIGNIYGSSSNVTLQAGSYSWTFDNTGNLVIPTTGNIVYANGTVFTSGTGSGGSGTTYSNANVVSMLAANTAVFIGNVGNVSVPSVYPLQSNVAQIFFSNSTAITSGGGNSTGTTYLMNNLFFGANGAAYYRATQSGAAWMTMSGSSGITFAGTSGAVTANTVQAMGSWAQLNASGFTTYNSVGITSASTLTVQGAGGIVTTQTSFPLVNTTATTINFGGAATTLNMGASTGIVVVGANTGVISAGTIISLSNFITNGNLTANGGGSVVSTGNSYTTGNTYTQYLVTTGNSMGNISGVNNLTAVTIQTTGTYGNITGANVISANTFVASGNISAGNIIANQYGNSIGTTATYSGNVYAGNVISTGSSGPQTRFLWDTWQANSTSALSSFTPSGTIGGNATWDSTQAYGLKLTTATTSQSGYINWNSSTINYNYDMVITASIAASGGTGADGQWIYFGSNAAITGNPGNTNTYGGIAVMNHYYSSASQFEVYVGGTQTNIPFIGNGNYVTSGVTLWNASYTSFYNLTLKIRKIQNGNRMLEVYLNEIYQGSVNIGSWTPVGNYFGVAAYTGGSTAQNWVRQLRIDW